MRLKKTFLFCLTAWLLGSVVSPLRAQPRTVQFRPYIDERRFHYGFCIGIHMQEIGLINNGFVDPETNERWYAEQDRHDPGFTVGVLGAMRLNKYFSLRLTPTLHFGQRHVKFYEQVSGRDSSQTLKSTYISVPILVKFAAPRHNNFRPYIVAGVAPAVDLTARKHEALRTNPFDCFIEVGMGCEIYLPFFKLVPELKFCFGLTNIINKKRDDLIDGTLLKFTNSLDGGNSNLVVLSFYFE
ncbi:MAG: PorT family protein [Bacteroidaceae bacterium]|nr:PorT family protein [Bacteroidaceae bacterium]MCF0196716.1 PorT family protein [Bacteroidaceae bacterium]